MDTKMFGVLRIILVLAGIAPGQWGQPWKHKVFRIYAVSLDIHYVIYAVSKIIYTVKETPYNKGLQFFLDSGIESMFVLCLSLQRYHLRWNEKKLLEVLEKLEKLVESQQSFSEVTKSYRRSALRIMQGVGVMSVLSHLQLDMNVILKNCHTHQVNNPECRNYIVEIWIPFPKYKTPWYEIFFTYNLVQTLIATFALYIFTMIIPFLVVNLNAQFKIISHTLKKRMMKTRQESWLVELEDLPEEELVGTIRHHQYVLRVSELVRKLCHVIVMLEIVFNSVLMIIAALALPRISVRSYQFVRHMMFYMIIPLSKLFTTCYAGEQLSTHSLKVHRAVYMNTWYMKSLRDKKYLLMMAIRAVRPVRLEVSHRFVPASLDTLLNVCQLSYSVYSVLLVTTK